MGCTKCQSDNIKVMRVKKRGEGMVEVPYCTECGQIQLTLPEIHNIDDDGLEPTPVKKTWEQMQAESDAEDVEVTKHNNRLAEIKRQWLNN